MSKSKRVQNQIAQRKEEGPKLMGTSFTGIITDEIPVEPSLEFKVCRKFFDRLAELLKDKYEVVGSCNQDLSAYLVPKGTKDQISYYGKPDRSFRVSDHWTWYSNLKKCSNPNEIQCYSNGTPPPCPRDPENPECATSAHQACQVAIYNGRTKQYMVVYGEMWDKNQNRWVWNENIPERVAEWLNTINDMWW